uniref:C2H2-type domain-containing protein n=1 Tax=Oreochromis aureus TaxID=47969 RepID=A0AAZ1WVD5_OREAU
MCTLEYLKDFIQRRLTAAAEEIFSEVEKTFVQYEEELERQRQLERKLLRTDLPQQRENGEEEILTDQERPSGVDQDEPQHPQIKEEQEELCTSQENPQPPQIKEEEEEVSTSPEDPESSQIKEEGKEPCTSQDGEQVVLKEETDTFTVTPVHEEDGCSEGGPNNVLLSPQSPDTENGKKYYRIYTMKYLERIQTVDKRYCCKICGKGFAHRCNLVDHMRIHTGEKPYTCETCGKSFNRVGNFNAHMRNHTGKKPYSCETCGKGFNHRCNLVDHVRIHTGEKPYTCETCGKSFNRVGNFNAHMRTHASKKMFSCETCGKGFNRRGHFNAHLKTHTEQLNFLQRLIRR